MKSMTGFGRAEAENNGNKITVEIKSVNHRFLDMNIRLPRTLMFLEEEARGIIKSHIARGRLEVYINYITTGEQPRKVTVDKGLLKSYAAAIDEMAQTVQIPNDVALSHLIRVPDMLVVEELEADEEELRTLLKQAVTGAVQKLGEAREKEGAQLQKDISSRLVLLKEIVQEIEGREDIVVEEYREKLKKRLEELLKGTELDENRFQAEIVYYADRQNVTEEVVRLKSHISGFEKSIGAKQPQGRQFDFIVQEMNREFNTIGSKSSDLTIVNAVLRGKSEVEKIREQIQNIE